jgi:hypothetical protein
VGLGGGELVGGFDWVEVLVLEAGSADEFGGGVGFLGEHKSWSSPSLLKSNARFIIIILGFFVEANSVREPTFPPKLLLRRDVTTTYLINIFQSAAQMAVNILHPLPCVL